MGVPIVLAALMAWYAVHARALAGEFGFPLDDSWIHARFAQNLAADKGFSFNPGVPTGLTTSPLWTLLLALAYKLTHEFLFTSGALNWLLGVGLCALVYHLSLALHPSRWLALAAAAVFAVSVPLPWWLLSGMEPLLYADLALLSILLHLRFRRAHGWRSLIPTLAMALAALARPELLIIFPLALLDDFASGVVLDKAPGRLRAWAIRLVLQLPLFALLLAPFVLYNHQVTGYWLPTSFYSKLQPDFFRARLTNDWVALLGFSLHELWAVVLMWAVPQSAPGAGRLASAVTGNNALLLLPFLLGLWLLFRQVRARDARASLLLPLLLVLQPALWALAGGYRPPEYQSQRYLAHLDALYVLVGLYGGWWLSERLPALRATTFRVVCVLAVLVASLSLQGPSADLYARNVKNITEMQVTVARWLRDNTPRKAVIAVNDVGAIGVLADRNVLDLQGLVTPETLAPRSEAQRQYELTKQLPTAMRDFVFSRKPDYIAIFPSWYPEIDARRDLLAPVFYVELQDNVTCGSPVMVVYRTVWAGGKRLGEAR